VKDKKNGYVRKIFLKGKPRVNAKSGNPVDVDGIIPDRAYYWGGERRHKRSTSQWGNFYTTERGEEET